MKKSSLGRRSSVANMGRLSVADKNVSRLGDGKRSMLPKPCSTGRSSSAERDLSISLIRRDPPSTLKRSKSYAHLDFKGTSTPCFTPQQTRNTGSMYSKLQLSEGGGRSSSFGGSKSAKKDSRPVTEKSFQSASQLKIQQFFLARAPDLLDKGSIKPMSTNMFVDLVNFLMAKFDRSIELDKSSLIDGVLQICKVLNYRGKAEKSWIRTVNTPHSWPHVVSFLVWLVELYEVSDALQVYEAMYPENVDDEVDVNDIDFKVLVPHLLTGYSRHLNKQDDSVEMKLYLVKHKQASNVDEEDILQLQEEYTKLQSELNNSEDAAEEEELQEKMAILDALRRDIQKTKEFIYQTEQYVGSLTDKHNAKIAMFDDYENRIKALSEEKSKLHTLVSHQEMSQAQKKEIETNLGLLQQEIQQLNETIRDYKDEVYKEDLQIVKVKGEFNKLTEAYNKEIVVNLATVPELRSAQIDTAELLKDSPKSQQHFQHIDDQLTALKAQLRAKRLEVETEIEKEKLKLQNKEDELVQEQEKVEDLEKECIKLENEAAQLRKCLQHDKDQTKRLLAKIQDDIEQEKGKIESDGSREEDELIASKKKKENHQREYDEYTTNTNTELRKNFEYLKDMSAKFKEVTARKMEERDRGIAKILNR